MVPWYNFVQPEDAEPEMWIGPYECYVEELGDGPSALDRAMTHTLMLQLDHERRFAVSQLGLDCSAFETDHCANVSRAINYAVNRLDSRHAQPETIMDKLDGSDLIGLKFVPTSVSYVPSIRDLRMGHTSTSTAVAFNADLSKRSLPSIHTSSKHVVLGGSPIMVDELDEDGQTQEEFVKSVQQWYREKRKFSDSHPRKYSTKRSRKPVLRASSEEHAKVLKKKYGKEQPANQGVTV